MLENRDSNPEGSLAVVELDAVALLFQLSRWFDQIPPPAPPPVVVVVDEDPPLSSIVVECEVVEWLELLG